MSTVLLKHGDETQLTEDDEDPADHKANMMFAQRTEAKIPQSMDECTLGSCLLSFSVSSDASQWNLSSKYLQRHSYLQCQ